MAFQQGLVVKEQDYTPGTGENLLMTTTMTVVKGINGISITIWPGAMKLLLSGVNICAKQE